MHWGHCLKTDVMQLQRCPAISGTLSRRVQVLIPFVVALTTQTDKSLHSFLQRAKSFCGMSGTVNSESLLRSLLDCIFSEMKNGFKIIQGILKVGG